MIVRAALCPMPPLLAAGVCGQADILPELREACQAAVAWLLAASPDAVTVVGPAPETAAWPPDRAPDLSMHAPALSRIARPIATAHPDGALIDQFINNSKKSSNVGRSEGSPPPVSAAAPQLPPGSAAAPRLPLALAIGAQLLDAAGYAGPRILQSVAESASPGACRDLGRDLAADAPLTALLVLGDGTARRSTAAPGYLDERAEPFDLSVEQAVRDGALAALAALDPDLARDLLAPGRSAWQVLAAALAPAPAVPQPAPSPQAIPSPPAAPEPDARRLAGLPPPARPRTRVLYSAAPLGVAYLVATLDPAP